MTNLMDLDEFTEATKGERTRAALLASAARRFASDGYQRTSITDVARDVGVSPAAVYRYFADREALFVAAVDAEAEALFNQSTRAMLSAVSEGFGSLRSLIARLVEAMASALDDFPLVARVLSGVEPMSPQRLLSVESLSTIRSQLAQLLQFGQQLGEVRTDVDPVTMALGCETIFLHQLAHFAMLHRAGDRPNVDDDRWNAVAAVVEAALLPPSPSRKKKRS